MHNTEWNTPISLSGQAFQLGDSISGVQMTVASHFNHFCFDNFLLQLEKDARRLGLLRVFLRVL
jgi:hypothetical protein